ncbi:MAG: efflux RND transporter periplasmic adaptor subunit [Proteobacteria bacterium]|nr:efflux RND transporter periplasmic adaptor subunit [Pseudomonadota bacterium]
MTAPSDDALPPANEPAREPPAGRRYDSTTDYPDSGHSIFGRPPPARKRNWIKTIIWVAVVLAAALLLAWGVSLLKNSQAGPGGPGGPGGGRGGFGGGGGRRGQTTVGTAKAVLADVPITFDALGTVTPVANVIVRSRIEGTLTRVAFREGQLVRAGQLLAQVDSRPYVIALKQAQGQLLRDEAQLDNAKLDLKRFETLLSQDSIARQQVDTQRALVKQLTGTVTSDQAAVAQAKLNIVYCNITAPVSGRVGLRHVDPGNFVTTGDANGVVTVTEVDPIDIVFAIPEDNVPAVTRRLGAGAQLPTTAFDRSRTTTLASGMLSALDNQVDTTTGTVKVKARFPNVSGTLFPAQFVNVRVLVDTMKNAVVVPTSAVRHGAPGDFVYTLTDTPQRGHTAHMRIVKPGPVMGENTAILTGLEAGETVITEGGDRIKDGAPVLLPGEMQRPGGAGGGRGGRGGGRGKYQGRGGQGGGRGGQGGGGGDGG